MGKLGGVSFAILKLVITLKFGLSLGGIEGEIVD